MKKVIIFGHSSGLGLALTKRFIKDGIEVVGVSRSKCPIDSHFITNLKADLLDIKAVNQVINQINKKHSFFDALLYCAGTLTAHDIDKLDYGEMEKNFRVNTLAPMIIESQLLDVIKTNKADVVNVTSSSIIDYYPKFSEYSASKIAFKKFTQDLQKVLADSPCRVMEFCPSGFQSSIYKSMSGERIDRDESQQMKAEDLADLILYLLKMPKKIEVASIWINRK